MESGDEVERVQEFKCTCILEYNDKTGSMRKQFFYPVDGANVTGPLGALSFNVKPEIVRRITRTAVLVKLAPGHLLHSFSCNSSFSLTSQVK